MGNDKRSVCLFLHSTGCSANRPGLLHAPPHGRCCKGRSGISTRSIGGSCGTPSQRDHQPAATICDACSQVGEDSFRKCWVTTERRVWCRPLGVRPPLALTARTPSCRMADQTSATSLKGSAAWVRAPNPRGPSRRKLNVTPSKRRGPPCTRRNPTPTRNSNAAEMGSSAPSRAMRWRTVAIPVADVVNPC